ncbi:MAG TPA: hypothetical protein VND64_34450 [Pirellulales bacterium]|nr:hypothetical protein [Pirellulales bacterium]
MKRTTITIWTVVLVCCLATGTLWSKPKKGKNGSENSPSDKSDGDDDGLPSDKRLLAIYKEFIVETLKVAREYEKNKDVDGARTCYEQILKLVPNQATAKKALEDIEGKELSAKEKRFNVNANESWQDTGVEVIDGKPISITAEGTQFWTFKMSQQIGPKGMQIPEELKEFNLGELIGAIFKEGTDPKEVKPFSVGEEATFVAEQSGRLYLRMYDMIDPKDNSGRMNVLIRGTFEKVK